MPFGVPVAETMTGAGEVGFVDGCSATAFGVGLPEAAAESPGPPIPDA